MDQPILQRTNPFVKEGVSNKTTRTIYYGEVISIDDPTDGGRIKVRILDLDNQTSNDDLPWTYPMLSKFFHAYPKVGEVVRIFIEDIRYSQKGRFWLGSIISQSHKINYDSYYNALSTTDKSIISPDNAYDTYPDAEGVYPLKTDIAIVGRLNNDIILRDNEVHISAGKHENGNNLKLNNKNPASISLVFEQKIDTTEFNSSTIINGDKIAIISHDGKPNFKAANLDVNDRNKIFTDGHPIARGDVLVEALKIFRNAIINHIHGYSALPADPDEIIRDLESIDLDSILQKNIVIN
jgi:hypothetical protein